MPPDRSRPDDPIEWLNRARSCLIRAGLVHPDVYLEDLCFDAQQAAEKSLKAVLLFAGSGFRRMHDIAELISQIERAGVDVPSEVKLSARLNDYAVEARYPGPAEPVTPDEHLDALDLANRVFTWAHALISPDHDPTDRP